MILAETREGKIIKSFRLISDTSFFIYLIQMSLLIRAERTRSKRVKQEYHKALGNQTVLKMDSGGGSTVKRSLEAMRIQEVITDARVQTAEQGNMLRGRVMIQEPSLQPMKVNTTTICT